MGVQGRVGADASIGLCGVAVEPTSVDMLPTAAGKLGSGNLIAGGSVVDSCPSSRVAVLVSTAGPESPFGGSRVLAVSLGLLLADCCARRELFAGASEALGGECVETGVGQSGGS